MTHTTLPEGHEPEASHPASAPLAAGSRTGALAARFAACAAEGRAALVGYLTAFDPSRADSLDRLCAACEAGLDVLELGVPFSDPAADGPTIQAAMVRALASGATVAATLDLAAELRRRVEVPIVLFSYANPLLRFGAEALALRASQAGASGLLLVDLPPEHCAPLRAPAAAHGLDWIGLVAPTTTPQRRAAVLANASGFIYAVSLTGVTGTALDPNDARLHQHLAELRASGPLPVVVGFGVRSPDDVRALARSADGVVVGSALVEAGQRGTAALGALVRDLRAATLRRG
jgi:tryptophan synthase alpha chain